MSVWAQAGKWVAGKSLTRLDKVGVAFENASAPVAPLAAVWLPKPRLALSVCRAIVA